MSSHHFVREGQEPALFIVEPIALQVTQTLLEWVPMVLVAEGALDQVLAWGIKIDAVLSTGSAGTTALSQKLAGQGPIKLISVETDDMLIRDGLCYLMKNRQESVNITALSLDGVMHEAVHYGNRLQLNVIDARQKWCAIVARRFEKWLPVGAILEVKQSQTEQDIEISGLERKPGYFEAVNTGVVAIHSPHLFWVGEPYI